MEAAAFAVVVAFVAVSIRFVVNFGYVCVCVRTLVVVFNTWRLKLVLHCKLRLTFGLTLCDLYYYLFIFFILFAV